MSASIPITIPITIVAGYLGAGKTTLINRALSYALQHPGFSDHLAVLVNDFGSINVDESLIRQQHPDSQVMGLANGCVCCSIADDFSQTLARLPEMGVQHILLEASGVALPDKLRRQCLLPGFHPSEVFVLVDALHHQQRLTDKYVGRLAASQVAQAGQMIITKARNAQLQLPQRPIWQVNDPALMSALLQPGERRASGADTARMQTQAVDETPLKAVSWHCETTLSHRDIYQLMNELPDYVERVKGFLQTSEGCVNVHRVASNITVTPSAAHAGEVVLFCPRVKCAELERHLQRLAEKLHKS